MPAAGSPFTFVEAPFETPILISVPHAGRAYSAALLAEVRLPASALAQLEDPLVDRLVEGAIAAGASAIVAHAPRAEIDLNRGLGDLDPAMMCPLTRPGPPVSPRASGGLGLIPARLAGRGAIWRRPLPAIEVERRVARIHRPYHEAIAREMARLRRRFGIALLLDCHSMPDSGAGAVVFGDRYGTSIADRFVHRAESVCEAHGVRSVRNRPYAGGEIVARHGKPEAGKHALQIEIARGLYLASDMTSPGPGFARMKKLLAAIVEALADAATPRVLPVAAE